MFSDFHKYMNLHKSPQSTDNKFTPMISNRKKAIYD